MAATARDEIIADWRKHLADAEEPLSPDAPRTAWLTRLKLRLYRFLLSLYGDGRWNASDRTVKGLQGAEPVVVSDEALPFSGKPAKDESQIRAVLNSVAGAGRVQAEKGPFSPGFNSNLWVIVASSWQGIDPELCAVALRAAAIVPRVVGRECEVTVEVQSQHVLAARSLIAAQRARLRLNTRPPPLSAARQPKRAGASLLDFFIATGFMLGPLVGLIVLAYANLVWPPYPDDQSMAIHQLAVFTGGWLACPLLAGILYVLFFGNRIAAKAPLSDRVRKRANFVLVANALLGITFPLAWLSSAIETILPSTPIDFVVLTEVVFTRQFLIVWALLLFIASILLALWYVLRGRVGQRPELIEAKFRPPA